MEVESIILFVIAALSINLIPGPDVIYIVTQTINGKMRTGITASIGLGVGYLTHTLAAVLGLSTLIVSSAFLFSLVKYLGAAYLLYLGVNSLINCYRNDASIAMHHGSNGDVPQKMQTEGNVFRQGLIISVLNPKVAMFFLAFLPQFIDPLVSDATQQLLLLGLLFSGLATLCNLIYASLGAILFNNPQAKKYARTLEGISGSILVALSAKIALSDNR